MLILETLGARPESLRELVSAGEPLNPEVIMRVRSEWGITIRDGYGQTETTLQVGKHAGPPREGRVHGASRAGLPDGAPRSRRQEADEGELTVHLEPRRWV